MGKKIIISITGIIIISVFSASWYFSSVVMYPNSGVCSKEHFVFCTDPSELKIPFEDVTFKSSDGLSLKGWFVPSAKSVKGIVMVHGHGANKREGLRWLTALNKAGFNVLLLDLRNSGDSGRAFTSMGYYEKNDVISAVDYLEKIKGIRKIGLFGVSMGGATGIYAMSMDKRVSAGVFEASYADLNDLMTQIAKRDFGMPRFPIVSLAMKLFEIRTNSDRNDISPERVISSISPRPVFVMHSSNDPYIPYSHAERIYSKAGEPKELWTFSNNKHAQAWQADTPYAENRVTGFFSRYIK